MTKIVEVPLDSGGAAYIEVDDKYAEGLYATVSDDPDAGIRKSELSFEKSLEKVRPALNALVENVKSYGIEEVNVEFGLSFGGHVGFLFAKTESEITFKVSMKVAHAKGAEKQS